MMQSCWVRNIFGMCRIKIVYQIIVCFVNTKTQTILWPFVGFSNQFENTFIFIYLLGIQIRIHSSATTFCLHEHERIVYFIFIFSIEGHVVALFSRKILQCRRVIDEPNCRDVRIKHSIQIMLSREASLQMHGHILQSVQSCIKCWKEGERSYISRSRGLFSSVPYCFIIVGYKIELRCAQRCMHYHVWMSCT